MTCTVSGKGQFTRKGGENGFLLEDRLVMRAPSRHSQP
jgi:hypothetical protein